MNNFIVALNNERIEMIQQLISEGKLKKYHTSLKRGYVSRKCKGYVHEYSGKFGNGFIHLTPNWDSTQYCYITYYIYC